MKMNTVTSLILGLLIFDLTKSHELNQFPENFEVVGGGHDKNSVTLTCNTETEGNIEWKFHDGSEEVISGDNIRLEGLNLTILDVDERGDVGEYSCWRGQDKLSSVYLLLEATEEDKPGLSFHCWAKSYDCNFNCEWTASGYTAVRIGLGHDCSTERRQSCQWHTSSIRLPGGGFQFELPHSLSPYIEESTMLEVTAEAIRDFSIFKKTKRFYLRDIIQPDSPRIVNCQEVQQGLHVIVNPAATWSTPHSFFSLENQIQYMLKDNGQLQLSSSPVIPRGVSKLRVRSRDDLAMSAWSQWTAWKNVGKRKNNLCKRKRIKKKCRQQWGMGLNRLH
ncbi:interleukin-12 subunit beta [Nelusetta ayraudi]|uniref:interleukin-12 subunit beta n=1 Tax=Nelusetta ayraudi TaxID=303726 RepID=UPI003F70D74A